MGLAKQKHPTVSFNGAALFQVRKAAPKEEASTTAQCFNGAALFQVRKVKECACGNRSGIWLQWGRTLSSAESYTGDLREENTFSMLQWGRTLSSAERVHSGVP